MTDFIEGIAFSRRDLLATTAAVAAAAAVAGCSQAVAADRAATDPGAIVVPAHGLYEVPLRSDRKFDNPFWDAVVEGEFVAPSGKRVKVDGFYYAEGEWRVRFVPAE